VRPSKLTVLTVETLSNPDFEVSREAPAMEPSTESKRLTPVIYRLSAVSKRMKSVIVPVFKITLLMVTAAKEHRPKLMKRTESTTI
jgi:hypothetical protein